MAASFVHSPNEPGAVGLPLEDTVPERGRWWTEATERYAREKVSEGEWGFRTAENCARDLLVWPRRFELAGLGRPGHARDVTAAMVVAWKANPVGPGGRSRPAGRMADTTVDAALIELRGFMRWARNPIAEKYGVWRHKRGQASRRRWYDAVTVDRVFRTVPEHTRPMVALMAWVGLRRREAWSLRVTDVNLAADAPSVHIIRKGGTPADLPIPKVVLNALRPAVFGKAPDERVYPCCIGQLDVELRETGRLLGIQLSAHDLRRTFGRCLYYDHHVDVNDIRVLYGHRTTEMTAYYIGADADRIRSAVGSFDRPAVTHPPTTLIPPVGV